MHDDTKVWLDLIRPTLPPEALPLASSLLTLARSMDSEETENGRVSASLAGAYRLTWQSLQKAATGSPEPDDDDDLLSPAVLYR